MTMPTSKDLVARCAADGEFALTARYWTGGLRLEIGEAVLEMSLENGSPCLEAPGQRPNTIALSGPSELWNQLLAPIPPRFLNDLGPLVDRGIQFTGDRVLYAQYFGAIMRAIELLRAPNAHAISTIDDAGPTPRFDAPVGRYVHLELGGADHRIYYEEAGHGIPLLLQHTAGCHGSQWRHLFEVAQITERFRLIAYDLPFHGKSLPPTSRTWWAEEYRLRGDFLRAVPLALAAALELDRPVFMGCSVGGLLALDLALRHPESFRAVIALEGMLRVEGSTDALPELWHPRVSNEYKARLMNGLMSPTSPEAFRKETSQVYAAGWPPAFLGDLHYYLNEYDITERASEIDTSQVAVHILSGEYDFSGTVEGGRAAHAAIAGSTFSEMKGVGHFPMAENPAMFLEYLLPVLEQIRIAAAAPSGRNPAKVDR